ncbi:hypothetical protein TIFTF001_042954 [Ficus carica]|uniref:Uncharacterized protein n=1 Tax=Ficus carica TaxID=3494 RepID=A0AA87YVK1_FICCA|nr:hypothetical protein TIFTF001_042954 [Ficus carica]
MMFRSNCGTKTPFPVMVLFRATQSVLIAIGPMHWAYLMEGKAKMEFGQLDPRFPISHGKKSILQVQRLAVAGNMGPLTSNYVMCGSREGNEGKLIELSPPAAYVVAGLLKA